MPILSPKFCTAKAKFTAIVDLPTPPLALETSKVNLVPIIGVEVKGATRWLNFYIFRLQPI